MNMAYTAPVLALPIQTEVPLEKNKQKIKNVCIVVINLQNNILKP